MNIIINFLIFVAQSIYVTIPAVFANMAPVLLKKVPLLNYPVDFGGKINGKPIFGVNKTFRGLIAGIAVAMILTYMQYFIFKFFGLKHLGIIDYDTINIHLFGFFIGFGVMFGDIFESFIKRRLNIPLSQPFIPWDQLDCALGGLLFVRIVWNYSLKYFLVIIVFSFMIHVTVRYIAYYLKITKTKW